MRYQGFSDLLFFSLTQNPYRNRVTCLVCRFLSVADLPDLTVIAEEPDRRQVSEVVERSARHLIFQHVTNSAEVIRGISGRLARATDDHIDSYCCCLNWYERLFLARPPGGFEEQSDPGRMTVPGAEDGQRAIFGGRVTGNFEGDLPWHRGHRCWLVSKVQLAEAD